MTAREERKAVWMQQGKQSHLHCKQVMGKRVSVFVCTLKLGKRGTSSHAIFTPLTPRRFYKFSMQIRLANRSCLTRADLLVLPIRASHTEVPGCFRMKRAVLGEQALCHKGPPNTYTAGRGVSFTISSGEK